MIISEFLMLTVIIRARKDALQTLKISYAYADYFTQEYHQSQSKEKEKRI